MVKYFPKSEFPRHYLGVYQHCVPICVLITDEHWTASAIYFIVNLKIFNFKSKSLKSFSLTTVICIRLNLRSGITHSVQRATGWTPGVQFRKG
jgi:hypothetical protein